MPPGMENADDKKGSFDKFVQGLAGDKARAFWDCVMQATETGESSLPTLPEKGAPNSFFLATDSKGICDAVHKLSAASTNTKGSVVCFDIEAVHLAKTSTDETPQNHHEVSDELHSHQVVVLDWWLLSKSRWIAGGKRSRNGGACNSGAPRGGSHAMYQPGNSYFGWALALSGLAPPPSGYKASGCDACGVNAKAASVWVDSPPANAR
mmetsp:Transcript_90675/g.259054  ORF Transcript_90675/g.259054 Transcript_90675/m.259054 type:complete len:208 (+) Transcript_90675:1183-1806(+)